MVGVNYERILEKISRDSGLGKEEIERRIEAKRAKLAGLISREGALQVIAAELGISFENEILKINEILEEMRKVNTSGKVIKIFPIREYTNKTGQLSKIGNLIIADDTGNIKIILWDINHIDLIENGKVKEGTSVEIGNASMRMGELHLGSFSELKPSTKIFEEVKTEKVIKEKPIIEFRVGDNVGVRAFVVQSFEPRTFHVCPECKKKVVSGSEGFICAVHQKVIPEKRGLVNIFLDDGTETIRTVLFHENLTKIGLIELEDKEKQSYQREDLLGKEMIFSGNVRMNKYFNNPEFIVEDVQELKLDELIGKLEN